MLVSIWPWASVSFIVHLTPVSTSCQYSRAIAYTLPNKARICQGIQVSAGQMMATSRAVRVGRQVQLLALHLDLFSDTSLLVRGHWPRVKLSATLQTSVCF